MWPESSAYCFQATCEHKRHGVVRVRPAAARDSANACGAVGRAADLDRVTGQPTWALVATGRLRRKPAFVPLAQAAGEDDRVRVPISSARLRMAASLRSRRDRHARPALASATAPASHANGRGDVARAAPLAGGRARRRLRARSRIHVVPGRRTYPIQWSALTRALLISRFMKRGHAEPPRRRRGDGGKAALPQRGRPSRCGRTMAGAVPSRAPAMAVQGWVVDDIVVGLALVAGWDVARTRRSGRAEAAGLHKLAEAAEPTRSPF